MVLPDKENTAVCSGTEIKKGIQLCMKANKSILKANVNVRSCACPVNVCVCVCVSVGVRVCERTRIFKISLRGKALEICM